ncbi:MAG: hypothetical protein II998_08135 [Clostridia bacterium]|nr:hypothetical protein [Clostridia bacterium]
MSYLYTRQKSLAIFDPYLSDSCAIGIIIEAEDKKYYITVKAEACESISHRI